jgi:hypothetical protein
MVVQVAVTRAALHLIDTDRVLSRPVAFQFFEAVGGRNPQVFDLRGGFDHGQPPLRHTLDIREAANAEARATF